tara:strand:+ start:17 stop:373 length:357 start_codon:yes stop_codon:yes gene_type:complete
MVILINNYSKGKINKSIYRYLSRILLNINNREFIGNIPKRSIEQIIKELNEKYGETKSFSLLILIPNKDELFGFKWLTLGNKDVLIKNVAIPDLYDKLYHSKNLKKRRKKYKKSCEIE